MCTRIYWYAYRGVYRYNGELRCDSTMAYAMIFTLVVLCTNQQLAKIGVAVARQAGVSTATLNTKHLNHETLKPNQAFLHQRF